MHKVIVYTVDEFSQLTLPCHQSPDVAPTKVQTLPSWRAPLRPSACITLIACMIQVCVLYVMYLPSLQFTLQEDRSLLFFFLIFVLVSSVHHCIPSL